MIITQSPSTLSSLFFFKPASQRAAPALLTHQSLTAPKEPLLSLLLLLPLCYRNRLNPKRSIIHYPPSTLFTLFPTAFCSRLSFSFASLPHLFPHSSFSGYPLYIASCKTFYIASTAHWHSLSTNIGNNRELDAPIHANQTPFSRRKPPCQNPASKYNRTLRTSSIYALSSVPLPHSKYVGPRKHSSSAPPGYTCCPLLPVTLSTSVSPIPSLQKTSLSRAAGRSYRQGAYHHTVFADQDVPAARNCARG